jgi:hypothetical protein
MGTIRNVLLALLLAASGAAMPAWASSYSIDQSDIWWNATESGWGIQFVQRGRTIFATMFVYDQNGNPTWYVAALAGSKVDGQLIFTGDLYASKGPWFGASTFDPNTVVGGKVGTMTWQRTIGVAGPGSLSYSVNGVNVAKSLTRQFIASDNYSGPYFAAVHIEQTGCTETGRNGITNGSSRLVVTQNGNAISLALTDIGCSLTGTYSQSGQFGNATGTFACTDGDKGSFTLSNMNVTPNAMIAQVTTASEVQGCQATGQIAAVSTD